MKEFLKNNRWVILTYLMVLNLCMYFLNTYDRKVIHLYLNGFVGNTAIDTFFKYITLLGDGTVAVVLLALLLLANMRLGIYTTLSFLAASFTSIGLKRIFFDDENRPTYIFNFYEHVQLRLVDGVHVYIHNSFPSGHATQAFSIFMCLAFMAEKQWVKFSLLVFALLTSYSRVHLSQHWLADITAGSVVGFIFSVILYFLLVSSGKLGKLNKSLLVFIRYWRSK